jgi:hypothetical protein
MLLIGTCGTALAAEPSAQDFMDGLTLDVLSRNFFLQNDYRSPSLANKNYKQEWAQGFIASFASGFTAGTVGFGVDAHGFLGLKLDGGKGHPVRACCRWIQKAAVRATIPAPVAR